MELKEEAYFQLKPHWEKILEARKEAHGDFLSEEFIRKYMPYMEIPEEEAEILSRAREVLAKCR